MDTIETSLEATDDLVPSLQQVRPNINHLPRKIIHRFFLQLRFTDSISFYLFDFSWAKSSVVIYLTII